RRGEDLGHGAGAGKLMGAFGQVEIDLERSSERPPAGCGDSLPVVFTVLLLSEVIPRSEHVGRLVNTIGENRFLQRDDIRVQDTEALAERWQARSPVAAHSPRVERQ